ncbi:MAG: YceI family protein [Alphaproteobacteria bacterium]|nr:YceI family protein [Alphaproteobacteria bacterium]
MRRLALATALSLALPLAAQAADYKIDPGHISVFFSADHIGYSKVYGLFRSVSGNFSFDEANMTAAKAKIMIKAESIDTNDKARDDHLRSPDFFNAKEFPDITFESVRIEKTGDKSGKLHGNLTLLGQTKPMTLDVTFNKLAPHPVPRYNKIETIGFSARGTLKRTDWGMKYAVPAVSDDIPLIIEVEGHKQ